MSRLIGGTPDPYTFGEWPLGNPWAGNRNTNGKVARDPRLLDAASTLVLIIAGQSNACNFISAIYSPVNASKIDNLNVYDSGYYAATDPLLGCESAGNANNVGNMFLRMADQLISAGVCSNVVLIPVGVAGQPVAQLKAPFGDRITAAFRRAAALGLSVDAVCYQQGEYDNSAGTSEATYLADLQAGIAKPRAHGFMAPWIIARCTYLNGVVSTPIRNAQTAVANGVDIFAGPDIDTLTGPTNRPDGTHLGATGGNAAGGLWVSVIDALL